MTSSDFARENIAAAHRLMLATLEVLLIHRAELDAKAARIQCAMLLDDESVLRWDDVTVRVDEEPHLVAGLA